MPTSMKWAFFKIRTALITALETVLQPMSVFWTVGSFHSHAQPGLKLTDSEIAAA
jgi:hypothetical protein